jgi:hypothetical protein
MRNPSQLITVASMQDSQRICAARTGARAMKRRLDRVLDHDADRVVDRNTFAVAFAIFQATPKPKPKLEPPDAAARFAVEKALQQRRYCNAFALWRTCRNKQCRREGACLGDADACLKRGLGGVCYDLQRRVRDAILKTTPANIGAPERKARQCLPIELYQRE